MLKLFLAKETFEWADTERNAITMGQYFLLLYLKRTYTCRYDKLLLKTETTEQTNIVQGFVLHPSLTVYK